MKSVITVATVFITAMAGFALLGNNSAVYSGHLDGSAFKPGRIMDDSVMSNSGTMSAAQIQRFLENRVRGGSCDTYGERSYANSSKAPYTCLYEYRQNPNTGEDNYGDSSAPSGAIPASRIIYNASQKYDINPQALLVLLQKEQGLITDDWPWKIQYRSATGYGCPDTADCDDKYYGFSNQVNQAAKYFRDFLDNTRGYNYYPPGNNNILYHPDHSCGSSLVYVENRTTSALYNYTPYQPNQAALNHLYTAASGSGSECAAYGNRNFWRDFTEWFGSTTPSQNIVLLRNSDNGAIYVIDKDRNVKIHIATIDAYKAWGFNEIGHNNVSSTVINSYDNGGSLRRVAYERGTGKAYLVDNKTAYHIPNPNMAKVWNLDLSNAPWLPRKAVQYLPSDRLAPLVKSPVGPEIYMMDGATLRHYPSPAVLSAWEINGRSTRISEEYFCKGGTTGSSCDFRWPAGERLGFPKATSPETTKIFFINHGNKHWLSSAAMSSVYSGGISTLSQFTLNRFFDAPNATALLTETYNTKVYLLDSGKYRHIGSPSILSHWRPANNGRITVVSSSFLDLLEADSAVTSFTATDSTNSYYMNQRKSSLEDSLEQAFLAAKDPVDVSPALMAIYPSLSGIGTPLVTSSQTSKIFFLNGSGTKHHIGTINNLRLLRGNAGLNILSIPHALLANVPDGGRVRHGFSVGGQDHVFDNGAYHKVTNEHWNLSTDFELDGTSLEWFQAKADLESHFRVSSQYGVIRNGTLYTAGNQQLGSLWNATDQSPQISSRLASYFSRSTMSPLVRSTNANNPRIYIYDGQALYHIPNPASLSTLNRGRFSGVIRLTDQQISDLDSGQKAAYILSSSAGVMDNGSRRQFKDSATAEAWGASTLATYEQRLIDLLIQKTNTTPVSQRITSSDTNKHFCMENSQKRWITSFNALTNSSCADEPLRGVSHNLLIQIPDGPNIH